MTAFSIARDGARLAVAYAGTSGPPVRVIAILRTDEGTVSGAGGSQELSPDVADGARIVDIGWRDPATLAVLSRRTAETSEVGFISADGSPTVPDPDRADRLPRSCPSDRGGARRFRAAAPDNAGPAALHPQQQRRLASDDSKVAAAASPADRLLSTRARTRTGLHSSGSFALQCRPAVTLEDSTCSAHARPWLDLVHGAGCVGCPKPGRSLCAQCASRLPARGLAVRPTPCPDGLAACFAGGAYDDLLRAMILRHKEHGTFSLAAPLGRVLAAAATCALDLTGAAVLVPIPSRAAVVRARGHDPVLRFARVAAHHLRSNGFRVRVGQILEQRGPVHDQAGLSAVERAANLVGSMGVRATARAALARTEEPLSLLLCDDVLTTGATAREAQRALEESGLRIRAVVTVAATRKQLPPRAGSWVAAGRALPLSGSAV